MSSNVTDANLRVLASQINLGKQNRSMNWFSLLAAKDEAGELAAQTEKTLCESYIQTYRPHMTPPAVVGWLHHWLDIFIANGVAQKVAPAMFQNESRWQLTKLGAQLWEYCSRPAEIDAQAAQQISDPEFCASVFELAKNGESPTIRSSLEHMDANIAAFKQSAAAAGIPVNIALYVRIAHPELPPPKDTDPHATYILSVDRDDRAQAAPVQACLSPNAGPVTRDERRRPGRRNRSAVRPQNRDFAVNIVSHISR